MPDGRRLFPCLPLVGAGDGRIPKDELYGELATGHHPAGCPALRFKDVCKCDLKLADIDPGSWEQIADDRSAWWSAVII